MVTEKKYKRKSIRLRDYDYSQPGAYFLTICTRDRKCLFGNVVNEIVELSPIGEIVDKIWCEISEHFNDIELDEYKVMPNHIHGVW